MTQTWNPTILQRDCDALTVPHGERVALTAGGEVEITQRLGSSVTVRTQMGTLLRIDGADADALGLDPAPETAVHVTRQTGEFDFADVTAALRGVYDPEIPVNIVDLGLVYDLTLSPAKGRGTHVAVKMTLTAPGCGMGPAIAADARSRLLAVPGVVDAEVSLVWDPPWSAEMASPEGRRVLGV